MRNVKKVLPAIFIVVSLLSVINVYPQETECKVMLPAISGSYSGDCKRGLAQGKGIARGIDRYEGQFREGVPHGRGIYTWANGSVYKGQWVKGMKEGEGEITYVTMRGDSVVTGFWKKDNYTGKEFVPPYIVIRKVGVLSSNFRKISDYGNDVIVRILIGGQINSRISGFSMVNNNGNQYKSGLKQGVENVNFPLELKISYTTSNPISMSSFDVVFDCEINEPGRWEVTINN